MKKLAMSIFCVLGLIMLNVFPVFADSGVTKINIPFVVLTSLLLPVLIGLIIYYAVKSKKQKTKNTDNENEKQKIVRDYDDK